jgi:Fic family protein
MIEIIYHTRMVYETPELDSDEGRVLELIDELRHDLRDRVAEPRRWIGGLRRVSFARAVQASNSIEGYNATLEDAVAAVDGEELLDADSETRLAVAGYRDAMTYVLQLAQDDAAQVDEGLLKALHFMMLRHDLSKGPGRWRPGAIFVRREPSGEIVYEGPDAEVVPQLIHDMLVQLDASTSPVLVRAAMAHLNLVMVHPFKDGNGRMARCLQTLVLARERVVAPVFSSIEEYLGRNTQAYYDVLGQVGKGGWNPDRSARPWIRFCLTAHYRQAKTLLRRYEEYEKMWVRAAAFASGRGLPERSVGALMDAGMGLRVRNSSYRNTVMTSEGEEITELTATRDLKMIVASGLFDAVGERRGRYYVASAELRNAWTEIRNARPPRYEDDPFKLLTLGDALDDAAAAKRR